MTVAQEQPSRCCPFAPLPFFAARALSFIAPPPPPPALPPLCDIPSGCCLFLYGALDSHPFFPSHVALGRCVLSAAAAGAPPGVVSAFAEPSGWCAGAWLVVAGAVCALAVPSSWRTAVVLVAAGVG